MLYSCNHMAIVGVKGSQTTCLYETDNTVILIKSFYLLTIYRRHRKLREIFCVCNSLTLKLSSQLRYISINLDYSTAMVHSKRLSLSVCLSTPMSATCHNGPAASHVACRFQVFRSTMVPPFRYSK